jgi:hypothetical protein
MLSILSAQMSTRVSGQYACPEHSSGVPFTLRSYSSFRQGQLRRHERRNSSRLTAVISDETQSMTASNGKVVYFIVTDHRLFVS